MANLSEFSTLLPLTVPVRLTLLKPFGRRNISHSSIFPIFSVPLLKIGKESRLKLARLYVMFKSALFKPSATRKSMLNLYWKSSFTFTVCLVSTKSMKHAFEGHSISYLNWKEKCWSIDIADIAAITPIFPLDSYVYLLRGREMFLKMQVFSLKILSSS